MKKLLVLFIFATATFLKLSYDVSFLDLRSSPPFFQIVEIAQAQEDLTTTEATSSTSSTKGDQPTMPDELPQTGPEDWLKWIVSGLALVGIGLLLL